MKNDIWAVAAVPSQSRDHKGKQLIHCSVLYWFFLWGGEILCSEHI